MCNMGDYMVFGHWFTSAGQSAELARTLQPLAQYARENQEDFPCIYILKEVKDSDEIETLTVSCFKSQGVYEKFRESDIFLQIVKRCESSSLLRSPQRDEVVELATGFPYRPHEDDSTSDSHVVIASIRYEPGTRNEGIKHWKSVTDSVEKQEEDTVGYCFLKSYEDEDILISLERYKSKEYFLGVHVPSEAIQNNIKAQKEIRTPGGLSHRLWKEMGNSRSIQ